MRFGFRYRLAYHNLAAFGPAIGVELSDVAVERATDRYHDACFVCADILQWRSKEVFDVVVSQEAIEHFQDQDRYLSVAHEILRPGGHIILTTPNARTVLAGPIEFRSNQPIENWLTRRQLYELVSRYFTNVRIRTIVLGYGSAGLYRVMNSSRLENTFRQYGLSKTWRSLALFCGYGLHFIVTSTKKA